MFTSNIFIFLARNYVNTFNFYLPYTYVLEILLANVLGLRMLTL